VRQRLAFLLLASAMGSIPMTAAAQSTATAYPLSSRVQITIYPVGGLFATEGDQAGQPAFGNFNPSAALTVQLTRFVAVEGEIGGGIGIEQDLDYTGGTFGTATPPSMLNYSGNLVVNLWRPEAPVVPYVAGGLGAVTLFDEPSFGLADTEHYFAANLGAGLKAMFGRWGLRGDYRLFAIDPGDAPPDFLGTNTRYAHRVTGGVVISLSPSAPPLH
jgi:hypothetical protein